MKLVHCYVQYKGLSLYTVGSKGQLALQSDKRMELGGYNQECISIQNMGLNFRAACMYISRHSGTSRAYNYRGRGHVTWHLA